MWRSRRWASPATLSNLALEATVEGALAQAVSDAYAFATVHRSSPLEAAPPPSTTDVARRQGILKRTIDDVAADRGMGCLCCGPVGTPLDGALRDAGRRCGETDYVACIPGFEPADVVSVASQLSRVLAADGDAARHRGRRPTDVTRYAAPAIVSAGSFKERFPIDADRRAVRARPLDGTLEVCLPILGGARHSESRPR